MEAGSAAPHLTVASLREYRAHRLAAAEEARVQEHLAHCDECRDLAVDVSAFFDAEEPGEEPVRVDKAASWGRLEASLAQEGWFEEQWKRRKERWLGNLMKTAAVLALFVVGALQLVFGYGGAPQTLRPLGALKGAGEPVRSVSLPVLLGLSLALPDGSATYRVDLLDAAGSRIRSYEGLRTGRDGRLQLRLRRWLLKPGHYRLEVRTVPDRGGPVDEFEIEVEGP